MSHTPGPWSVGDKRGVWTGPVVMADNGRRGVAFVCGESEANAHLIAAAPDLLATVKRLREVFEQLSDGDWRHLDATYVDQLIESDGLIGCDQVIAKAKGRTE